MDNDEVRVDESGWVIDPDAKLPDSFGAVVGANVQTLRAQAGMTQTVFARLLRETAGGWTKGNVAALERGARPRVTVAELVLFAHVLRVPLASLFAGAGEMYIEDPNGTTISRADLRKALSGGDAPEIPEDSVDAVGAYVSGRLDAIAVEIAERLGASIHAVISAASRRYGQTVTAEHAARVGPLVDPGSQSAAVKRGNVTRQLVAELKEDVAQQERSGRVESTQDRQEVTGGPADD